MKYLLVLLFVLGGCRSAEMDEAAMDVRVRSMRVWAHNVLGTDDIRYQCVNSGPYASRCDVRNPVNDHVYSIICSDDYGCHLITTPR